MNCKVMVSSEDKKTNIRRGRKKKNSQGITEVENLEKDHSSKTYLLKNK